MSKLSSWLANFKTSGVPTIARDVKKGKGKDAIVLHAGLHVPDPAKIKTLAQCRKIVSAIEPDFDSKQVDTFIAYCVARQVKTDLRNEAASTAKGREEKAAQSQKDMVAAAKAKGISGDKLERIEALAAEIFATG